MEDIVLRHSEPADVEGIRAIYAQPHAYADTLQLPYPSKEAWENRLASPTSHSISLVAELGGEIVGQIGLTAYEVPRRKHVATLGMAVSAAHQGSGIGSELMAAVLDLTDNWMNVKRVELEVYAANDAAVALYKKFGFEVEGTLRQYAFRDGQYVDALAMARLKDDRG